MRDIRNPVKWFCSASPQKEAQLRSKFPLKWTYSLCPVQGNRSTKPREEGCSLACSLRKGFGILNSAQQRNSLQCHHELRLQNDKFGWPFICLGPLLVGERWPEVLWHSFHRDAHVFSNRGNLGIAEIPHGTVLIAHLWQSRTAWEESLKEGLSGSCCSVGM